MLDAHLLVRAIQCTRMNAMILYNFFAQFIVTYIIVEVVKYNFYIALLDIPRYYFQY
jgi:hypothetical protein